MPLVGLIITISPNIYANYVGILKWGGTGTGPGQFNFPDDSAIDASGDVFVADSGNNRIQMFRLVSDNCPSPTKEVTPGVCFITMWGKPGGADGQLRAPSGVAVNSSGDVFVADSSNNRIQVFRLANPCPVGTKQVKPGVCFVIKWGSSYASYGTGPGGFQNPQDVTVDSKGNVFVADTSNKRIQVFRLGNPCQSGTTQIAVGVCQVIEWGLPGPMQLFNHPTGIAVDSTGAVFVTDPPEDHVDMFRLLSPCPPGITQVKAGVCLYKIWGSHGAGKGQFDYPWAIAVDSNNDLFVADTHNNRVQKFHLPVHFVSLCPSGTIHLPPPPKGLCWVTEWGSPGFGTSAPIGQFSFPAGLSVDPAGRVYVADSNNDRIQVFKQ